MLLRLPDPDARYSAVRLYSDLPAHELSRHNGEWRLELREPALERLEYQFEVDRDDGGTELLLDPGNPHRAPGAFGEKSVLLLPGYEPPNWLRAAGIEGRRTAVAVPGRGLAASVDVELWSPADADSAEPLPLLVAHDGSEYDELSALTRFAAAKIHADQLPRHRIVLLAPGERDEWYSASARYTRALTQRVLPAIAEAVSTQGPPAAIGASLGALALLHAEHRHPGTFSALFLQSGSFFMPRFDAHESGFPHYHRVVGFVREIHRLAERSAVPTTLTCGAAEENIHNNREMAATLGAPLHEVTDTHNYTAWRDALDPHLTRLLADVW